MATLHEKLAVLLKKIKNKSYEAAKLKTIVDLQERISKDIGCTDDPVEAMALLGYLFKYKYIEMIPQKGIIINEEKINDIDLMIQI